VTPAYLVLAVLVAIGGVAAIGARVPRVAALGLLVVLVGSPFVADPLPAPLPLAARLVGGVLAAYLVFAALRRGPRATQGAPFGWPGAGALLIVLLAAGWLVAGNAASLLATAAGWERLVIAPGDGPTDPAVLAGGSLAAGSAIARAGVALAVTLAALAITPVLLPRDVLRLTIGLLLLLTSAALVGEALAAGAAPTADGMAELAVAAMTALLGAGGAAVIRAAAGRGDLALSQRPGREPEARPRPVDDAHPAGRRE
jgi:hypothetical protein